MCVYVYANFAHEHIVKQTTNTHTNTHTHTHTYTQTNTLFPGCKCAYFWFDHQTNDLGHFKATQKRTIVSTSRDSNIKCSYRTTYLKEGVHRWWSWLRSTFRLYRYHVSNDDCSVGLVTQTFQYVCLQQTSIMQESHVPDVLHGLPRSLNTMTRHFI